MKLARRSQASAQIPTSSMSDIAFLLILFFMVTTVFSSEKGLKITLPKAEATQRIRLRSNTTNVWIDKNNSISIDDKIIPNNEMFAGVIQGKLVDKPDLVVLLRVDKDARYGLVSDLIEKMKEVKALKLTFSTQFKNL
ncbi:biopolymer transporter ExbD [bacterium]|nr:biopolymer transporter ExbD [bacterium]